jgi:hypothetical protein
MAKSKQPLKSGEKILLIVFAVFFLLAMVAYVGLETVRVNKDTPMYEQTTFFDFSEVGMEGYTIYREARCSSCHRAVRSGTSMGLILDGIGSKRSQEWLEEFLVNPEKMYGAQTVDHGLPPKEAAYVARMSSDDRYKMSVFLSELRATAGSSVAKVPPPEHSAFIDNMVKAWAPKEWDEKYEDIRDRNKPDETLSEPAQ